MKYQTDTKTTIEIYDPAMCCSTGVCGTDIDDTLADFANDVKWIKSQGVEVKRYNLAQEPEAFKMCVPVLTYLQKEGSEVLPIIIVNGEMVSQGGYPDRKKLSEWAALFPEKKNGVINQTELLSDLEKAVSEGDENGMKTLFLKGKKNDISIEALVGAMQSGIDNRQQVTQRTLQTANELLGVQPGSCAPGSGCC
ncbi:MAG: arsenical resistance operon transcriptional repressor ArsD [Balneolaceae bacterium]|nr:MAG: arsenical resistance operon transcriptional repressor ArsD [Balneolaceae bacterium]